MLYDDTLTETTVAELAPGDLLPLFADGEEPFVSASTAELAADAATGDVTITDYVSEVVQDGGWHLVQTADGREFLRLAASPIVVRRPLPEG